MRDRDIVTAGVAGILWPVLAILRVFLTGELDRPSLADPPDAIVQFYRDAEFSAAFVTGLAMVTVAYMLFVVFVSKAAEIVGHSRGQRSTWIPNVIVGGAVLDVALVVAHLAAFATATFLGAHGTLSGEGYLTLHALSFSFYRLDLIVSALWIAGFGAGVLRSGRFPQWLGWALVITAFALVVSFWSSSTDVWDVASGLPYLWVLTAAFLLLFRIDRYV